ncbi:hypothetical protein [Thalassospira lohafexi]|uniref:Uncharacterized protein n=1 Tax=Thalassospira lohafexi TaxID=744227 RepID=A0A2N3LAI1_9PROT|nr:hypothetical protein [Thalassospira lohafexi]PKR59824.1 hypothetical protein COO92_00120 [Thalassospira lohafexi]
MSYLLMQIEIELKLYVVFFRFSSSKPSDVVLQQIAGALKAKVRPDFGVKRRNFRPELAKTSHNISDIGSFR